MPSNLKIERQIIADYEVFDRTKFIAMIFRLIFDRNRTEDRIEMK